MLPFPWWFRSVWKWSTYSLSARRKERSPNRINFDRHSSLTDLTQRSAVSVVPPPFVARQSG